MRVALADLLPNPYRDLGTYPIHPEKVLALQGSMKDTGFWENIVIRKSPTQRGKYEIAYGHHRMISALGDQWMPKGRKLGIKGCLKRTDKLDLPCKQLDDATMVQMMANENMDEWDGDFRLLLEVVRAVLGAAERGEVELPKATSMSRGYIEIVDGVTIHKITPISLATFLGSAWTQMEGTRAKTNLALAFRAERLIREGYLKPKSLDGIRVKRAEVVIQTADDTRRAWKESEAQAKERLKKPDSITPKQRRELEKVIEEAPKKAKAEARTASATASKNLRKPRSSIHQAEKLARKKTTHGRVRHWLRQAPPDINELARSLANYVDRLFSADGPNASSVKKIMRITEAGEHLTSGARKRLLSSLSNLVERVESVRDTLSESGYEMTPDALKLLGLPADEIRAIEKQRAEE